MTRSRTLYLERLEDRTTPTTLTVSFVPDGTQIGGEQSQLYQDLSAGTLMAPTQQSIFNMLQTEASQYDLQLSLVSDDGASMNSPASQDGQLRVAAVDQAFHTGSNLGFALPNGGNLIVESQVTFGVGLGLIGPNGPPPASPATPPVNNAPVLPPPNTPPTATLPFILPFPTSFGNLYPSDSTPTPNPTPTPTPPPSTPIIPISMTPTPPPPSTPITPISMTPSSPSTPVTPIDMTPPDSSTVASTPVTPIDMSSSPAVMNDPVVPIMM